MEYKSKLKDARGKWMDSYAVDLALRPNDFGPNGDVKSASCLFCETYGREIQDNNSNLPEAAAETSGSVRKRRKTTRTQHWTTFRVDNIQKHHKEQHGVKWKEYSSLLRVDNIQKHHKEQHGVKWKEYSSLLRNKLSQPDALKGFFKQTRIQEFFERRVNIEGGQKIVSIGKNIVEVIIQNMLQNSLDDSQVTTEVRPLEIFKPVFSVGGESSTSIECYNVIIAETIEFDYVVSLLASGLSFKQISNVIESNRKVLSVAAKLNSLSPGDISATSRSVCAIALELLSDIIRNSWAFSIAADASTDEFGNAHLDVRIRLPSVQLGKPLLSFHLLAIPLFDESHSGQSLFEFVARLLGALCPDWNCRLLGSSTDGAPNMTGAIQGFSTRLSEAVAEFGPLYRIWCLAHQLDIVIKASITSMYTLVDYPFEKTLTTLVGYLRRQEVFIRKIGSKCPYWINVRWKSISKVLKWLLEHRLKIQNLCNEKQFVSSPSSQWWLLAMVLQKQFFSNVNIAFSTLQIDSSIVSRQYDTLTKLLTILQGHCGAIRDEQKSTKDSVLTITDEITVMGQFTLNSSGLDRLIRSTSVAAQETQESLSSSEHDVVLKALSATYLSALNGVATIVKGRQSAHVESDMMPPVLPLQLVNTSECDFIALVRKHKKRLVNHFGDNADAVIERICDQHTKLKQTVNVESELEGALLSACDKDFEMAWAPGGSQISLNCNSKRTYILEGGI